MFESTKFPCPRCGEQVCVTETQLLNDRQMEFGCACCGSDFTVENPVPAAIDLHFRAARARVRKLAPHHVKEPAATDFPQLAHSLRKMAKLSNTKLIKAKLIAMAADCEIRGAAITALQNRANM
jgi:hypothetical protein